jgi:hypothetical protein
MDIGEIRQLLIRGTYEFSAHAHRERLQEDLDIAEIEGAIVGGEILEDYPTDPRGESCLVLGYAGHQPVQVVLGWARRGSEGERVLRVITVYIPRLPRWRDPRTRGGAP